MSIQDAFQTATDRLQGLLADPQFIYRVDTGPMLVKPCPACNGKGYTQRPEEGHLHPRQLCPACNAEGRYITKAGLTILELLAAALEPRPLVTADELAEYMANDAIRSREELARAEDRNRRAAAAAELERQTLIAKRAILMGSEADLDGEPSGALARDLLARARSGKFDYHPAQAEERPSEREVDEADPEDAEGAR